MPQWDNSTEYPSNGPDAAAVRRLALGYTNAQTGTTYTLLAADNGVVVLLSNTDPITLTVPSGLSSDFRCSIIQGSTGQVTVTGSGATVNAYSGWNKLAGQYAGASLLATASNVYILSGNLTA